MKLPDKITHRLIDSLTRSNFSFAIYRLPWTDECYFVMQTSGETECLNDITHLNGKKGFVIAPFKQSDETPLVIIQPDIVAYDWEEITRSLTALGNKETIIDNEATSYPSLSTLTEEERYERYQKAFERFPSVKGLIMHSDQGWHYRHKQYVRMLQAKGIQQSMSRKGNCYDNCIMETFFGRLKNEIYYGYENEYKTFEEFSNAMKEYIDYYNNERIQAKTKWMPPVQYRLASMC